MKLRVKEKSAPAVVIASPGEDSYLTDNDVTINFNVTDHESGVSSATVEVDNLIQELTKVSIPNGYRYTGTITVRDGVHNLKVTAIDNDGNTMTKTIEWTVDTVPPALNISAPPAELVTNQQLCTVSGVTNDATSGLASIKIEQNGTDQGEIAVTADGSFTKVLSLVKGENVIIITAADKAGKQTAVTRTVQYDPDAPVIISVALSKNPVDAGELFEITVQATD